MENAAGTTIERLLVSDVTGQKVASVGGVPADCTIGEMIQGLLAEMQLPQNDGAGRPLVYHARLEREGRHLHGSESVADALQSGDMVMLTPNIAAGVLVRRRGAR
jgi:hypothetical protein